MSVEGGSPGEEDGSDQGALLPRWVDDLDPDLVEKLEATLGPEEFFQIEASVEWWEGEVPPHIAVQGLEQAVPGCGPAIVDEGLERSRLERKLVNRHSWASIIQSSASQLASVAFGAFALFKASQIAFSEPPPDGNRVILAIVLLIVGVGGPIAAAILARNFNIGNGGNEDPHSDSD